MTSSISIIVPVYSGADYLKDLTCKIQQVQQEWLENNYPFSILELIFVDDCSSDGSSEILYELSHTNWINVVTLSRNYGQHAATAAGISYSSGDWVVTMDEDLQHDPAKIFVLLKECIMSQSDVIYARPRSWVHNSIYRDMSSRYYKKLISWLTSNPSVVQFNSYRLMRGSIARAAASVFNHDGYFDVVLTWYTNKIFSIETEMVDHRYVEIGQSGYSLRKLFTHARKLIMTSDAKTLRLAAYAGIFMLFICTMLMVYFLTVKTYFPQSIPVKGWTSLMLATLFTGGGILLVLSFIAEYIAILTKHVHGKPPFVIVDRSRDKILRDFFLN